MMDAERPLPHSYGHVETHFHFVDIIWPTRWRSLSFSRSLVVCTFLDQYAPPATVAVYHPKRKPHNHHGIQNRIDWRTRAKRAQTTALPPNKRRGVRCPASPRTDLSPGQPLFDQVQAYKKHFSPLIEAEQREEEDTHQARLANWTVEKLIKEGYCVTNLAASWTGKYMKGQPVAKFTLESHTSLPSSHHFRLRTQVIATYSHHDPLSLEIARGSVVAWNDTSLEVRFHELFSLDEGKLWRLDVGFCKVTFERMQQAIDQLFSNPAAAVPLNKKRYLQEPILQGTFLRDILLNSFHREGGRRKYSPNNLAHSNSKSFTEGLFKDDARIISWARRYSRLDPVVITGDPLLESLDSTQVKAIAMMLNNCFCLVQGPPGTGKTKTIIEMVKLLKIHFKVPYPILLCTFTNVAVDHFVDGCIAASLRPLRIDAGGKVNSPIYNYLLETQRSNHPLAKEYARVKTKGEAFWREALELSDEMLRDIVLGADVVCTTSVSSTSKYLNITDFPFVVIDEASMSTEPASLIPLMRGSRHVALIGDHKQLSPVVTSTQARAGGLDMSLFERLADENFLPSIMLDVQYRMHPCISRFPSAEFYQKGIRDGTVDASGSIASHLLPPHSFIFKKMNNLGAIFEDGRRPSVVFLDHAGSESGQTSKSNVTEAHIISSLVEDLLLRNPGMKGSDIGIIAPYAGQVSRLAGILKVDKTYKERFQNVLGEERVSEISDIEIKTVDGFQGREKDVIICSTVRNNARGHIGFLDDRRRMNVALTRARKGLFIVGSIDTLRQAKSRRGDGLGAEEVPKVAEAWHRYVDFLNQEKLIVNVRNGPFQEAWSHFT